MSKGSQSNWAYAAVAGSAAALAVGNAPVAVFTFGVFAGPLIAEFGWSRGELASALTAYTVTVGVANPFFGALIDRYGVRFPSLISAMLALLAFACLSQVRELSSFFLIFAVFGLLSGALTPMPYAKLVAEWFSARRGRAMALAMAGTGVGTALMPLYAKYLIDAFGWRTAYLGIATSAAVVFILVLLFLIREPNLQVPVSPTSLRQAEGSSGSWLTVLSTSQFWLIASSVSLVCLGVTGALVQCVPLLTDHGISQATAVSVLAVAGLASGVGRLTTGLVMDYVFAPFVAAFSFVLAAVGLFLFSGTHGAPVYFLAGALVGFALGAEVDVMGYLVSRYFRLDLFGRVYGLVFFTFCVANGAGAYLLGLCYDITGSYALSLYVAAFLALVAAFLISRLGPYVFPAGAVLHAPTSAKVPA